MSRGPGRIERAVVELVASDTDNAFTIREACRRIYGMDPVQKKHLISVARAAKSAIKHGANIWIDGVGGRGHSLVLCTPDNLTSYGMAKFKRDNTLWPWADDNEVRQRLAVSYHNYTAPGGLWWRQVELFKAKRAGETERVDEIETEIKMWYKNERQSRTRFYSACSR